MGRPVSASKLPIRMGDLSGPHLTHGSLGPPKSTSRTASRSVEPFCRAQGRDRQTDRPRYSVCSNRPHLASVIRYCLLKPNSITLSSSLAGRRPASDQIPLRCLACDQLASRSATSSRGGRRPATEQHSVMEYGLNRLRPGSSYLNISR